MPRQTIKQVLMKRDEISAQEADNLIEEAKDELQYRLAQGEMPYDICEEYFGLEPDYIDELISF